VSRPVAVPRRRARAAELHLLRPVPGSSPVHRLWAGSKLLAVAALSVALSVQPTWPAIGIVASVVLVALRVARIPAGAAPRPPRWFWYGLGLGLLVALSAGGTPVLHVAGLGIGLGGLADWLRFLALALTLATAAAVVGWTTPLAEIAPALARLGRPLRLVRIPVDELAVAVGLGVRCLPLLVDEARVLFAARRLRHPEHEPTGWRAWAREAHDLLAAALVVSVRRAAELAAAIDARGGTGTVPRGTQRLRPADVVVLLAVSAVAATAILV